MFRSIGWIAVLFVAAPVAFAADEALLYKSGPVPWWWDKGFWDQGALAVPDNHPVKIVWEEYRAGEVKVPVMIARPADDKKYPAVLYAHGRRGLDDLVQLQVKRLAARGFVVAAPDVFKGRFMDIFPIEHDYVLEDDMSTGVDYLLARTDVSTTKACLASHTRGGYYTLKVAVTRKRQEKDVACYVSWYPHLQDPNAPEPMQVYRYAVEVDALTIPVMIFMGENEQYQRKRGIEEAVKALRARNHPVTLVEYPGVGRGFDFRSPPDAPRSFADDLANRDAVQRAALFMRQYLVPHQTP
jgi:carboxymethylenebutenolidase